MLLLSGRILTGILTPLICMFGIPANIINCIVFYKLGLRQRINFLLFSHACTDLAFDLYSFVLFSESFCSQFVGITLNFYGPLGTFMLNSGLNTLYGFAYASGFLSTLIACERCFCIVRPLMVTWFLQTNTVCVAVCVTITALVCLHYIPSERYKLLCVFDPTARIAVQTYYPSDFYIRNKDIVNILSGAIYGFGLPSAFVAITIVTTAVTFVYLRSAAKWRQTSTQSSAAMQKEMALTKMLIAISCWFIVCRLPDTVHKTAPVFVTDFRIGGRLQNLYIVSLCLVFLTLAINSSVNMIFYFRMGSMYRKALKCLFCRTPKKSELSGHSFASGVNIL